MLRHYPHHYPVVNLAKNQSIIGTMNPYNEYPKLVRDRIPEIIKEKTGVEAKTRTLAGDDEFLEYLLAKFVEESVELKNSVQAGNLEEELADLFELIYTLLRLRGKTIE